MARTTTPIAETHLSAKARLAAGLRAGVVYRREELMLFTNAVDRHLRSLVNDGALTKLAAGIYYAPKKSVFGYLPPDDQALVEAFLRDKQFLMFSAAAYNSAGLGATQLYTRTLVYNHKRHGVFTLGKRSYDFRVKPRFPQRLTPEFVFVDALNNIAELAEDQEAMLACAERQARSYNTKTLQRALANYGNVATKKRVKGWLDA